MIKNILIILLMVLVGWLSIDYLHLKLPTFPTGDTYKITQVKKTLSNHKREKTKQPSLNQKVFNVHVKHQDKDTESIDALLRQNRFYDALAFYLDHCTPMNVKKIKAYLSTLAKTNPDLALEYMQVFLDNAPQSGISKLMIKTYISQKNFYKAIDLMMQEKENATSDLEEKRLSSWIKEISLKHIDRLMKQEEYGQLIAFLEEMMAYNNNNGFYSFRLAQLYMKLDKVEEASVLLHELEYDEVYAQNVTKMLKSIEKVDEDNEGYQYAIPLQKYGDHYAVNVSLDGTEVTLMLDTGATIILIDEDKASHLKVLNNTMILQTAGNDIKAKLCQASSMKIGNLELANIQMTAAPFKRNGIDGLLGMNFFKQFDFMINQNQNILYLNPKKGL